MRITKRQLKRIIKEEKRKLMNEGYQGRNEAEGPLRTALDQYVMAIDEDMGFNVPEEQLKAEVLEFVDDFFRDTAHAAEQAAHEEGLGR